jgi:Flp pilus assembly protein TadD
VLNNLGYHHMLRGNLNEARGLLLEAASKDPGNPRVQGNLYLLDTWQSGEPRIEGHG